MEDQVKAGIKALLLCKKKLKKETLLNHDDMKVMLQISAIKVAPGRVKQTIKLPMPAPFHSSAEICLFVKDLKRGIRVDHDKSQRHWREVLEEAGVTRVTEVMPLRQLKAEYSMYEARRKLCDAYDVFLSDVRVTRLLPTLLGKHFIVKKKQPVSVNMEAADLSAEIDAALSATYLHLHNSGACSTVQVGRCGQSEEQLTLNVLSAVRILRDKFPGGLRNIRSLHLKLDKSPAVPIFVSDVPSNSVPVPAARRQPGSNRAPVVGELSTARAQSDVIVDRFGNVQLVQKRPLSDDEEESEEESEEEHPRGGRGRKRTKPAKKARSEPPAAAPVTAADPVPSESAAAGENSEDREDAEDSSDEEDRQLEAREERFLSKLAAGRKEEEAKTAAGAASEGDQKASSAAAKAANKAARLAKKNEERKAVKMAKKLGRKGIGKAAKKSAKTEPGLGKEVSKNVNSPRSPSAEKPATAGKKYAKKKGKNIGAVKKVK